MACDIKYRSYKISVDFLKWVRKQKFDIDNKWLVRQVSRSIASIGANLVEAQGSSSNRELSGIMK